MKGGKNITRKKLLVMAIVISNILGGVLMILPSNASAVMVNVTGLEPGYDQENIIDLIADIYIESGERIPIQNLDLNIWGPTNVNASFQVNGTVISSPAWIEITLLSVVGTDDFGYGYGYTDYYDYNYGYRYGYDHDVSQNYDFGYGYGYVGRLKYSVKIDTSFMTTGNYTMQLTANTGNIIHTKFSSDVRTFAIWPLGVSGDSWPQFQNNAAHTGYSTSEAPDYDYQIWSQYAYSGWSSERYPVINEDLVILSGVEQKKLWCYDEETGALVWQFNSTGYVCPGPAIYNDAVIFGTYAYNNTTMTYDGMLYSVTLQTAQINWFIRFPGDSNIASARITVADNRAFFSTYSKLYCVDLKSASVSWFSTPYYPWSGFSTNAPVVANGSVYTNDDWGYDISIYDVITGQLKYRMNENSQTPLAISNEKLLYGNNNRAVVCRDTASLQVLWNYQIPDPASVNQPMAFAYGKAYFVYYWYDSYIGQNRGKIVSINATDGMFDWSYEFPGYCYFYGGPAVADGKIYIGSNNGIYCFDANNGTVLWSRTGWPYSEVYTPSVANGKVFFSNYNYLHCFGLDKYAPTHNNEWPAINGRTNDPSPFIQAVVEDQSGVVESSIRMYVNGIGVFFTKSPYGQGYQLVYDHEGSFYNGQNVSVRIVADDIYGNKLSFTWYFIVDLIRPTILSYSPIGTNVSVGTDIRVTFSEPMGGCNFWTNPWISGNTTWIGNTMVFTPSQNLEYNSNYTVYLWDAWDLAGNNLLASLNWTFLTGIPELTPPTHSNECPPDGALILNNTPIISVWVTDTSDVVQSTIRLYIDGYSVFYNLDSVANGFNVSYYWDAGFDYGRNIVCRIVAEDIYGNRLDYSWDFTLISITTNYKIPVHAGWNLISIPLIPSNSSMPDALIDINGDTTWSVAKLYDGPNKRWKSYRIGFTTIPITIDHMDGVWVYITNPGDGYLNISGSQPYSTTISLHAGWNLVGYPSATARLASETLPGLAGIVAVYKASSPWIEDYSNLNAVTMSQGNGYWVHVTSDCTWVVNP